MAIINCIVCDGQGPIPVKLFEIGNYNFTTIINSIDFHVDHKKCFQINDDKIYYMVDNQFAYICYANNISVHVIMAFFEEVRKQLEENKLTHENLIILMDEYSNPSKDLIKSIQLKIDQISDVMKDNIDNLMSRGEKLSNISDKAEQLETSTKSFKKKTTEVKCEMIKNNIKSNILLIVCVIILLLFFVGMIYGLLKFYGLA